MVAQPRMAADRTLRVACVVFALFAFIYYGKTALASMGYTGVLSFLAVAAVCYALSQLVIPLMVLKNYRTRTGDPGSFVLDASVFAFAFALFGWYAAALLHLLPLFGIGALRIRYPWYERVLRIAPGVPFWFLLGYVRDTLHGTFLAYSIAGFGLFIALLLIAHYAYIFVWFDGFFSLRSGQPITRLWKSQIPDWAMTLVVGAQAAWGYGAVQMYLSGKPELAVASFVPLVVVALLLRRDHRNGVETYRAERSRAAMDAVLHKEDPRPHLRELLESAQSEFLDETLAVFVPSGGAFQAIVHCGAINAAQSSTAVQSSLHRAAALREARIDVAGDGTWAVYPVFNRGSFIGGLVVYRPKRISESIERPELQRLVDDMAPVIGNVSDIIATQDAANVDALTGVLNRFGLEAQLARLAEHAFSGVAMMVDIDAFKAINDTVGHQRGDAVLQAIAGVISEHSRQGDVVGRFGGDEFLVLLNGVEANEALSIGNRMRDAVAERANATISIGLAAFHQGEDARDFVKRADEALYAAKGAGRNCCVVAP